MKLTLQFRYSSSSLAPAPHALRPPRSPAASTKSFPTPRRSAQLELRAQQANPRDQCFLYTELVHTMTEIAGKQMLNGDTDQATATLKKVDHYAQLIHIDLASQHQAPQERRDADAPHHLPLDEYLSRSLRRRSGTPSKPPSSSSIRSRTRLLAAGLQPLGTNAPQRSALRPRSSSLWLRRLHAQSKDSALSEGEIEQLRDVAYVPDDRVLVFIKLLDERTKAIQDLFAHPRKPGREQDTHDLLEQFTSIADELDDNLDDYGPRHRDIRKALPKLIDATERWSSNLKHAARQRSLRSLPQARPRIHPRHPRRGHPTGRRPEDLVRRPPTPQRRSNPPRDRSPLTSLVRGTASSRSIDLSNHY